MRAENWISIKLKNRKQRCDTFENFFHGTEHQALDQVSNLSPYTRKLLEKVVDRQTYYVKTIRQQHLHAGHN